MIRLRGHHILCTKNFTGKGYSKNFAKNMSRIVSRLRSGERAIIVEGCDDICICCPHMANNHCNKDENSVRLRDERVQLFFGIKAGEQISVRDLWEKLKIEDMELLCQGCEWYELCKNI